MTIEVRGKVGMFLSIPHKIKIKFSSFASSWFKLNQTDGFKSSKLENMVNFTLNRLSKTPQSGNVCTNAKWTPIRSRSEKPIRERRCHFCTAQDKINGEEWCWSFRLCAAQQEAVRGEMERTKLNQASVFHLVKHNATLFPAFYKKTRGDCGGRETHLQELQISLCYQQGAGWQGEGGERECWHRRMLFPHSTPRSTGSAGRESCQPHVTGLWCPTVLGHRVQSNSKFAREHLPKALGKKNVFMTQRYHK